MVDSRHLEAIGTISKLTSVHGVAPRRMVGVSASVNLPLHHNSRSSFLALAHPGGPGK